MTQVDARGTGPLHGVRVVELAGLGPAPFAGMVLADLGAEVLRIERPGVGTLPVGAPDREILFRGRRSVAVDLRNPEGARTVLRLCGSADVLIEGNRPGVAERLGVGPDDCRAVNPALIYARATGWGQDGPLSRRAGHDLTYTALTGALHAIGEPGRKPVPPLNLVADFGGGAAFLVIGVLAALWERRSSGLGQVVDAAMVDGASYLLSSVFTLLGAGEWKEERGTNLIDGGCPFYDTYLCRDGRHVAVAPLEPQFWAVLVERLELPVDPADQWDESTWPRLRTLLTDTFLAHDRDHWTALLEDVDACVAPVLSLREAPAHRQLVARGTHQVHDGLLQPAPAPRLSRTPARIGRPPERPGASTRAGLADWGLSAAEIADLEASGAVHQAEVSPT